MHYCPAQQECSFVLPNRNTLLSCPTGMHFCPAQQECTIVLPNRMHFCPAQQESTIVLPNNNALFQFLKECIVVLHKECISVLSFRNALVLSPTGMYWCPVECAFS